MDPGRSTTLVKACPNPEDWSAFHLGRLPEDAVRVLAEHLQECPACSSFVQALEGQADHLLRELRESPQDDSYSRETACREALDRIRSLAALAPDETSPIPGRLGPYRLLRQVGQGSMGAVFQAHHEGLDRVVALKTLSSPRASNPDATARFRREIEVAGRLDHPHIIRATDAGESDGTLYLVMEFVEGTDLARLLLWHGPLPIADACELVRQAALGLHHAHLHGLIHRDVKPSNLLLGVSGEVKVLDLGLALPPADFAEQSALTTCGQVLGTLDYMAPEQSRDTHAVDARTDIYSLGCTLYHLLTGHAPFVAPRHMTPQSKLWAHAFEAPPPLESQRPDVPPELAALVGRLLAKEPAERPPTAAAVAADLAPFAEGAAPAALLAGLCRNPVPVPDAARAKTSPAKSPARLRTFAALAAVLLLGILAVGLAHRLSDAGFSALRPGSERAVADDSIPETKPPEAAPERPERVGPTVYPTALFVFEERGAGAREMGQKVTDLLFAKLAAKDRLTLVDREDLKKTLGEAELNLSGAVKPAEATKVGQLTGAKILVTGSVIHSDKKLFLVAKIIGTETSRVAGASVDGKIDDELEPLVAKLADKVAEVIATKSDDLVAKIVPKGDRIAALKEKLKKGGPKPTVMVKVSEKHIGAVTIDPAAQTELLLILKECGFEVIDAEEGQKAKADVILSGEGLSTFAVRHGNLLTVKARLEIKAVERATDRVLAVDRQTVVVVELSEALAGKSALQEAAAEIAERLLPKLLNEPMAKKP